MSLDILKSQVKSGQFNNLYLFCGPEEFLKKYYLDCIAKQIINKDFVEMNKIVLDGKVDADRISGSCEAFPVFSDNKLVIVKNSGFFKPKKKDSEGAEEKQSAKGDRLQNYLNELPSYTCLIFCEDEVDKRLKITSLIKKKGLVVEFPYQNPIELVKWVKKGFKANRKEIDNEAASMLIEYCEPGMTDILNEINKLSVYKKESNVITMEDIGKACSRSIKSRIFDLTDAVAERDGQKALKLLNDMIELKEPIPRIFYMIIRQLRLLLQMKLMREEGISESEAASKLSLLPFAARKISAQLKTFSTDKLAAALEECLNLDTDIKTGKMNDRMAAELLIAKLAT